MSDQKTLPLRVLHAAVSMNPSVGVIKQMEWEQRAADALGLHWRVVIHTPHHLNSPVVKSWSGLPNSIFPKYIALRMSFYRWLVEAAKDFDLVILRHSVHDVFELASAVRIGKKMITMHHTMEMPELIPLGRTGRLRALLEKSVGASVLRRVSGIAAVTPEILNFQRARISSSGELPGFVYPNGVLTSSQQSVDNRGDLPELLFVASHFSSWHGLDLLINSVLRSTKKCKIHIVGSMNDADHRRTLSDPRFEIHGQLNTTELRSLMTKAWCGLSSFALSRQKMEEACTLKVREYLESGLPVFAGHRDSGLPSGFEFFRQGEAELDEILVFAHQMRPVSREEVQSSAEPYISKQLLLKDFYTNLQSKLGRNLERNS